MNPLLRLKEQGQSVWLDFLSREMIDNGHLEKLIKEDGVAGITANPSTFEKAIAESTYYDADIARLNASGVESSNDIYERLATADVRRAADLLQPLYEETRGRDGFVSLEVSPRLAMDTDGTIGEARRLWQMTGRPNVMIKVPGTAPGIPAIRALLGEGINVNITLLFSRRVYEQVLEAYVGALEDRASKAQPVGRIASVASFFVSRIDTAVDKLLAKQINQTTKPGERAERERLRGKIAIANAKQAYQRYHRCFAGQRWLRLAKLGAQRQRLLWASTGTKNPEYGDVLYVEGLIGPDTVNTMPQKTMDAFRDHGKVDETLTKDIDAAPEMLASLDRTGISLEKVTEDLVVDGVRLFSEALDKLLATIADKSRRSLDAGADAVKASRRVSR